MMATTHDGRIPIDRATIRDPQDIITVMARDIRALRLPPEGEDWAPLRAKGWTATQCRRHFLAARMQAHQDSLARQGVEAFALFAFLAAIIAACMALAPPMA